jgi:ADP-ribosylglycohydrolase
MSEKYEAMFILHSLGDTIGFRNGISDLRHKSVITLDIINEFLYRFIALGGINGLDISDWKVSDVTLYHMSMGYSMLKYKGNLAKGFILSAKNEIIKSNNLMADEIDNKIYNRYPGIVTSRSISNFTESTDASHMAYNEQSGGNGCAVRMLCVGACLYGKERRDELIDVAIRLGKMTHNSPIGFLGGLNTALFVAFSIEGIDINMWPVELLNILKSKRVKSNINFDSIGELSDFLAYIKNWQLYIDSRFDKGKPLHIKSQENLILRMKFYHENFVKYTPFARIGGSGYSACIMAYDILIDCDLKWEKLVVYSTMHPGDTNPVGAIAGGLFGIHYGYMDTPKNLLDNMEFSKELKDLAKKIYSKYSK